MPPKADTQPAAAAPDQSKGGVSGNSVFATITLDPTTGLVYTLTALSLQKQFTGDSGSVLSTYSGTLTYNNIANLFGSQTASASSSAGKIVVTFVQNTSLITAKASPGSTSPGQTNGSWGSISTSGLSRTDDDSSERTSVAHYVPPLEVWSKKTSATANINLWDERLHNVSVPVLRKIFISASGQVGYSYSGNIYYNDARAFSKEAEQLGTVSIVDGHLHITFTTLETNTLVGVLI
ncbi:hypothetical protein Clacol_004959 [Clathrus columnatus]|uniref:Uncharacterized protein n=1 Tax=Clathrus columnatus TaxID=1419009 RepID=A0AAV5AAK8_9AGAM|nr:hypothetical protein Clacol_004959 [Clathrus columnatus]